MRYLVLFFLISCSVFKESEIYRHVYEFENICKIKVDYPISFSDNLKGLHGICVQNSDGSKFIKLNRQYWESASYYQREALVLHELGHCSLNLGHNTNMVIFNGNKVPMTLMYPHTFYQYESLRNLYRTQLFTYCRSKLY